uniref:Pectinesterase n=1 Tax=Salix viminalis TaxID=40686 RepID=A0A6N2MJQ4_SALVM
MEPKSHVFEDYSLIIYPAKRKCSLKKMGTIKATCMAAAAVLLLVSATASSNDTSPIPGDPSILKLWFRANVKPYRHRKGTLDPALEAAEAKPRTIKVRQDGSGDYRTLTGAVESIPSGNTRRVIVDIAAGVYIEKIKIEKDKPFITFRGSASNMPTLTFAGTARVYGTVYSATLQAVALRIGGDKAAFYNCRLIGFQDTLCDDMGRHFFKNCYIEGTVDFIFGSGKSLYLATTINVLADQGLAVITAQARHKEDDTGFSFVHCKVNGIGKGAYLGRAWTERPRVVFAYTEMSSVVDPAGWSDNLHPERDRTVSFGEYKCKGPGSNPSGRVKFSRQLTPQQVKPLISLAYIEEKDRMGCIAAVQCAITVILLVSTTVSSDDKSRIPADPSSLNTWFRDNVKPLASRKGTLDPALEAAEAKRRTIKVRRDGSGEFKTLKDAIKSIPTGNTERVIVDIGPGEYVEKLKIERGKRFVTFRGSPGNMPTLSFAGTAREYGTVYSATLEVEADYFVAANIIIKNSSPRPNGKLKGEQAVALRIAGDKSAFYNCRLIGFQDTLCDDKGRHLFKDCYIEGTVDYIFGSGKSLYLGTKLQVIADAKGNFITAQARKNEGEDTGFSFVHCKVEGTGSGAYLGRAWQQRPRVVFAYTTMSGVCNGAGANTAARAKSSKKLTADQVAPFISLGFIEGSKWLLPPPS